MADEMKKPAEPPRNQEGVPPKQATSPPRPSGAGPPPGVPVTQPPRENPSPSTPLTDEQRREKEKNALTDSNTPMDPQGRVKQQDAAGNFIADENELRQKPPKPQAPNVITDPRVDFTRNKMHELEQQAIEAENLEGTRRLQARAQIRSQIRELKERENATFSGANVRAPRGSILNAEEALQKHPEYHYRFVNILARGKPTMRRRWAMRRLRKSDGGKTLGDLALFRIPLVQRARRQAGQEQQTKDYIKKVTEDLRGEVREMARYLRRKGVDIDENRLGVFSDSGEED